MEAEPVNACKLRLRDVDPDELALIRRVIRMDSDDILINGARFRVDIGFDGIICTGSAADVYWLDGMVKGRCRLEYDIAPLTLEQRVARLERHINL